MMTEKDRQMPNDDIMKGQTDERWESKMETEVAKNIHQMPFPRVQSANNESGGSR